MVVIESDASGKPIVWCDPEIADLVRALNAGGIRTVASCSGHGHRPGNIVLADGREMFIAMNFAEARQVDAAFPMDINGDRVAVGMDVPEGITPVYMICNAYESGFGKGQSGARRESPYDRLDHREAWLTGYDEGAKRAKGAQP